MFFYLNLSKNNKTDIFQFSKWLHRVEWIRKHLEKLLWSRTDHDTTKICELKVTVKFGAIRYYHKTWHKYNQSRIIRIEFCQNRL